MLIESLPRRETPARDPSGTDPYPAWWDSPQPLSRKPLPHFVGLPLSKQGSSSGGCEPPRAIKAGESWGRIGRMGLIGVVE